jgi:hypothetical protein
MLYQDWATELYHEQNKEAAPRYKDVTYKDNPAVDVL